MKNLKKVLALVLACVMVFGTVAMAAGTGYPDVAEDAAYAEAVKTLSALNIIKGDENGNFNPDATITRAEMAKILCTMVASGDLATTSTTFDDVADSHWASGYINYAQQLGYIEGYDAKTFGPEDPVTYEQVLKLVMAALGYTYKANENGGYPTGYLYVAADAEVTKGAAGKGPEAAPRSTVAITVNNAMNTPVMERTSYGTESKWEELDGTGTKIFKTLLTSKLKVYKVEGKIENSYKHDSNLKDGYVDTKITKTLNIDVEGKIGASAHLNGLVVDYYTLNNIDAKGTDAADYVGYTTSIYFKELDNGDIVVVNVVPKSAKNKELTIPDVVQVYDASKDSGVRDGDKPQVVKDSNNVITKFIFSYWNDRDEDSRITTIDIDPTATIYVNNAKGTGLGLTGTSTAADIVNAIKPARGSIIFVDTDNDGMYDLIKVVEYKIAIVESANPNTNRINFKSERTTSKGYVVLSTDTNKNLKEFSIKLDGKDIEVKDLAEYDVLNISTNDESDPTYVDIIVTRNVVEGSVTQVNSTSSEPYVVINGEKYKVAGGMNIDLPELEDEGKFYLDAEGKIAFVDTKSVVDGNYAYLYSTGDGTFGEQYVRMFTKDGADVSYELADKVKINDVNKSTTKDAYTFADVYEIFGVAADKHVVGKQDTDTVIVSDVFDCVNGEALTPASLMAALTDAANKDNKTAYNLKAPFVITDISADVTPGEVAIKTPQINKFITYKVDSSNKITSISLATKGSAIDEFGYVSSSKDVEWQASLSKFKTSLSIPDNTVIFFVEPGESISDYSVKTVADLSDGNYYTPFFFSKTDDGPAAILMLEVDSAINSELSIFVEATKAKVDYDDVYNVTYWKNGALVETPLIVKDDADVTGLGYTRFDDLKKGDVFVYGVDQDNQADKIRVIFTPGTVQPAIDGTYTLMDRVDVTPADVAKDFKLLDDSGEQDSEVYFGYIGKISSISDGVRLTLVDESGSFGTSTSKMINVPKDAKVILYNSTMADAKKIQAGSTGEMTASFFKKLDNGDMDLTGSEAADMNYAFVRVYKDVVTDVVYVRYARD